MKSLIALLCSVTLALSACGSKSNSSKKSTTTGAITNLGTATTESKKSDTTQAPAADVGVSSFAQFDQPIAMVPYKDGFLVAQKTGKFFKLSNDGKSQSQILDIGSQLSSGNEQGLLGLAVSPEDANIIYVDFTNSAGDTRVVEYKFQGDTIDTSSARVVLAIAQPYANHNGGNIVFGPDGFLYIGMGDGGSAGDPQNRAQNKNELLGKILRIDPAQSGVNPYSVPSDNPFVGQGAVKTEIWAYGLRNPWRFSFDKSTSDLWIGDVGQDTWEEVDHVNTAASKGANFGWSRYEGTHDYNTTRSASNVTAPIYEYQHQNSRCSITGGFVYRGSSIVGWQGRYFYGDYCTGEVWWIDGDKKSHTTSIKIDQLDSFAQGADGELYLLSQGGSIQKLVAK